MVERMIFAIPFQALIPTKCIGVINGPIPSFGLDRPHEFLGTHRLDDFGVHAGFLIQEPEDDAFAGSSSASFPLAFSHKVSLVQLDLSFQLATFQLGQMVQGFSESPLDASDHFDIEPQILRQPIGGLQLIKPLENRHLSTQPRQTFALSTQLAFHITTTGVQDLEGTTKNTLATP